MDHSVYSDLLHQLPLERVDTHERVDSTNSEALRLLRQGQTCPFLVLAANRPTAGAGAGVDGKVRRCRPYYTLAVEVHQDMQNVAA